LVDYRKFLNKKEAMVLPYLGGPTVSADGRRLRLEGDAVVGWHRFELEGRKARALEAADPPEALEKRPKVRGHFMAGWLFTSGDASVRLHLVPDDEPEPLSIVIGRKWHDGEVLFGGLDFDGDPEMEARLALEEEQSLAEVKGVGPSLRYAFGYALVHKVARRLDVPVSFYEVKAAALTAAREGVAAAEHALTHLVEEREARARLRAQEDAVAEAERRRRSWRTRVREGTPEERAEAALDAVGGTLLSTRRQGEGLLEVTFRYLGQRFISVVDQNSLHVYDAGICLDGHDEELTLESLPSVIREAVDTSQLVITRR